VLEPGSRYHVGTISSTTLPVGRLCVSKRRQRNVRRFPGGLVPVAAISADAHDEGIDPMRHGLTGLLLRRYSPTSRGEP
jgi:hypothetical protein